MPSKEKILCLDDSKIICAMVKKMLAEGGYENVTFVFNLEEAKTLLEKEKFDIVLLDYNIEDKTSENLLDLIKEKYPGSIVIMLSGQMDKNIVVKLMRKADDYIVKDDVEKIKDELLYSLRNSIEMRDLRIQNIKLMNEIKDRNDLLKKQLTNAQILLKEIFPKNVNPSGAFSIKVMHRSWEVIGGDFYHIDKLNDNKTGVFISDIAGHGIQSALLLFTLSNSYRETINGNTSAKDTLKNLNEQIIRQFPESLFVTCCYLILDEENKKITFSSAFENPLLFLKEDNEIIELSNGKLGMIGIDMGALNNSNGDVFFEETELSLKVKEKVFLFTDGIVETKNDKKEIFGIDRVKKIIRENNDKPIDMIIKILFQAVCAYSSSNINDDITVIGIERKN